MQIPGIIIVLRLKTKESGIFHGQQIHPHRNSMCHLNIERDFSLFRVGIKSIRTKRNESWDL